MCLIIQLRNEDSFLLHDHLGVEHFVYLHLPVSHGDLPDGGLLASVLEQGFPEFHTISESVIPSPATLNASHSCYGFVQSLHKGPLDLASSVVDYPLLHFFRHGHLLQVRGV